MSQVFLFVVENKTLWVPTHRPTPDESAPVVVLTNVTQAELTRSFVLFDIAIVLVDNPRLANTTRNARSTFDIVKAVNEFREQCHANSDFMLRRKYEPQQQAPPPPPQPMQYGGNFGAQQQQQPNYFEQGNVQNAASFNIPSIGLVQPSGMFPGGPGYAYSMGQPAPPPSLNYAPGYFPHAQPQHHQFQQQASSMMYAAGGTGMPFSQFPNQAPPPPPVRGGRSIQQQFSGQAITEPEPISTVSNIPDDIREMYRNTGTKVIITSLPNTRSTVWLRGHTISAANVGRYIHAKQGVVMLVKPTQSEIEEGKPVFLFDKPVCTFFALNGHCSRLNCLHTHHSEEQVRDLVASKHAELSDLSKDDRKRLVDELLAKEAAIGRTVGQSFGSAERGHQRVALSRVGIASSDDDDDDSDSESSDDDDDDKSSGKRDKSKKKDKKDKKSKQKERHESRTIASSISAVASSFVAPPPPPPPPAGAPHHFFSHRITVPIGVASDDDDDDGSDWSSSSSSSSSDDSSSSSASEDSAKADPAVVLKEKQKQERRVLYEQMISMREGEEVRWRKQLRALHKLFKEGFKALRKKLKKDASKREKQSEKEAAAAIDHSSRVVRTDTTTTQAKRQRSSDDDVKKKDRSHKHRSHRHDAKTRRSRSVEDDSRDRKSRKRSRGRDEEEDRRHRRDSRDRRRDDSRRRR